MYRQSVNVDLGHRINGYIISTNNNSPIVIPSKGSVLWGLLKQYVECVPSDYMLGKSTGKITIILPKGIFSGVYSATENRRYNCNMEYRCYISGKGTAALRRHFGKLFKGSFHVFMTAYFIARPDATITDAIYNFIDYYNIGCDDDYNTYELLRKDWWLWRKKTKKQSVSPFII